MKRTAQDILNFVEDNDVKFAKLTFCDIFGNQKNISLFASELPRAFAQGISSFLLHFDCKVTKNKLNCLYKTGSF